MSGFDWTMVLTVTGFCTLVGVLFLGALLAQHLHRERVRLPTAVAFEGLGAMLEERRGEIGREEAHLADLRREVAHLQQVQAEVQFWLERLTQVKDELAGLDERHRELEALKAEIARHYEEATTLRQGVEQKRAELAEAERRLRELVAEAEASEAAVARDRDALARLEAEIAAAQQQRATLIAELAKADQRRQMLKDDVGRLAAERDTLTGNVAKLRAEASSLEATRDALRSYVESAKTRQEETRTRALEELLQPPACLWDERRSPPQVYPRRWGETDEHRALDRVANHLGRLNLRFSRRTLHAFHTSLKIAHISPLTVLAGISGTGKSQLPRRYTEAMGVHFLPIAVQPRWDSPQDLFGFYNYLEQRYKATELARALVHLDAENWRKQAEPFKDRVLMVLLDEMNLARVEYYFSEFLSRLEMRPRAGENPADRKQAEIELELGQREKGQSGRVYAGENVLFVGTMNEDESTQALSDKVMDRGNVLRFSRPTQLSGETPGDSAAGAAEYLPLPTWLSWRRDQSDLPPGLRDKVKGWISTLNDALDGLGRPFGHRVNQAIFAYVANHPEGRSESGAARAFADQLEQRIFPKLRGVELESEAAEHLNRIRSLVTDGLRDDALSNALARACDRSSSGLFVWAGVRREE